MSWPRVWVRMCVFVVLGFFCAQINAARYGWRHSRLGDSNHYTPQVSVASYGSIRGGQGHKKSFASKAKYFLGKYLHFSSSNSCDSYRHHTQEYSAYEFLNFNTQDFALFFGQQIASGVTTELDILRLYQLYSNSHFLIYLMSLPGYQEHILRLDAGLHGSKDQVQEIVRETGFKEDVAKKFFAACAGKIREKRLAQEQERALQAQAERCQQEELLRNSRKIEVELPQPEAKRGKSRYSKAEALANCVVGWHKKQHGLNGVRYKKRLAAAKKLAQNLDQNKQKIKRVYKITDRDHELIKELNLRKSDFVVLQGHELQHVLHREFIGIMRNISDICRVTVRSITGQDWIQLLGTYLNTGMQVNKMGDCAQASKIADFCWTVTAGLGEILLGVGEGIWQGGKNVAHMVLHPLDTGYGATCALGVMLIGCGDILMCTGDPELPIDNEYSTFQRARDPAQAEYLLHIYNSLMAQASQSTPRDIARGVSTMVTEAILTAKLSSAAIKCITSINSRVPGALHRALSCAPETAESFALADGGHVRISKNALQALAESEGVGSGAAASIENRAYDVIDRFNKNRNHIDAFDKKIKKLAKKASSKRVGEMLTIDTHALKVDKIEAEAASFYDSMRQTMADVELIAKNTGLPKDIISKIKSHVFLEEHILRNGVRKFCPDGNMAAAWKRLMGNNFVQSDLLLLQHEYAEALIMRGLEVPYGQAHPFVNQLYNWKNSL